jgi:hypothetical protein
MLNLFKREIERELKKHPVTNRGTFTEKDLFLLPHPVKRYFIESGWIGKPQMSNASIQISQMELKMKLEGKFSSVTSYQFNSVAEPVRLAFMKSKMLGVFPYSGRDKFQDGEGNMLVKLFDLFPVINLKGMEMNKSALVTVLAETFLAPSYALQPYIRWTQVDDHSAIASLTFNNISVSGAFHFNDKAELMRFETTDRYMTKKDGSMTQMKWIASMGNYKIIDGIRIATEMSAGWETEDGFKEYARMVIENIKFDICNTSQVIKI